ncbi:MAG: glycosyltransferase [Bacteroidales bacterium]|jgi:glycosyltransferase involved in cell wall biosynthesis
MKVVCIGNYVPRQCGIATFTENLTKAIKTVAVDDPRGIDIEVIAMNDAGRSYAYPAIVAGSIDDSVKQQYLEMADRINRSGAGICLLQHEYGIYGGDSGLLILGLLRRLEIPLITTCHTVLNRPGYHQKAVMEKICHYSSRVVVMSKLAKNFLQDIYHVPPDKIAIIEHGVPDFEVLKDRPFPIPEVWKNKRILLTFGLIGRNKGIETAIRALPAIVAKHPDILYVVLGKTHPNVVRQVGEEYRAYLQNLTKELGLSAFVMFMDQYLSEGDLMSVLRAAEIYITPYLNQAQITSGTLSYAVAGGCAVVSTPYWHAKELLANERGLLFPFENYCELSDIVSQLLENPGQLTKIQKNAFEYGRNITWPKTGIAYHKLFEEVISDPGPLPFKISLDTVTDYPILDLTHLERLTDDTGLLQHANSCVPNYKSGYCIDDNSRALIVCLRAWKYHPSRDIESLVFKYLSYINFMSQKDGNFTNYLTYSRVKVVDDVSDDAFGRTFWALGYLIRHAPTDSLFQAGHQLFNHSLNHVSHLRYIRGYANCIFGLYHYLKRFPDQDQYQVLLIRLADALCSKYYEHQRNSWDWFEETMTYDNGLLPAALYQAFRVTRNPEYLRIADQTCLFLESKCFKNGWLSLIGNRKWLRLDSDYELFAQQPIDALAMVVLYECAWGAKGDPSSIDKLLKSFNWFFGKNDLDLPVYDSVTKGCNDGIEEFNINRNQGAESTIAYLFSRQIAERFISR